MSYTDFKNKYGEKFLPRLIFNIILTLFIAYFFISIHLNLQELSDRELIEEKGIQEFKNVGLDVPSIDYTQTETSIIRDIIFSLINLFLCIILIVLVWISEQLERIKKT